VERTNEERREQLTNINKRQGNAGQEAVGYRSGLRRGHGKRSKWKNVKKKVYPRQGRYKD
jgi:hypothetical protein